MENRAEGVVPRCPHCRERPAAARHRCPLDLETSGCNCCGPCEGTCSDVARHRFALDPTMFVDFGTGEVEIAYWAATSSEDDRGAGLPPRDGGEGSN